MSELAVWVGIGECLTQSALFSGLNLAVFSLSRLRLEAAAEAGDLDARRVLALRRDANFTLTTILRGNVAINVLLTLLADSVLVGAAAFLFSTVLITVVGEIVPQAYFSRHALSVAARLSPLLRVYRLLLWPVSWPSAGLLDAWIGPEGMPWMRERELGRVLAHPARGEGTEISRVEAAGAINLLALDDLPVGREGEPLDPRSVMRLPFREGRPVCPDVIRDAEDPFLRQLAASGKQWVLSAIAPWWCAMPAGHSGRCSPGSRCSPRGLAKMASTRTSSWYGPTTAAASSPVPICSGACCAGLHAQRHARHDPGRARSPAP